MLIPGTVQNALVLLLLLLLVLTLRAEGSKVLKGLEELKTTMCCSTTAPQHHGRWLRKSKNAGPHNCQCFAPMRVLFLSSTLLIA
jgi:hypothetical protein